MLQFARDSSENPSAESVYPILGKHALSVIYLVVSLTTIGQACLMVLIVMFVTWKRKREMNVMLVNLLISAVGFSFFPLLLVYARQFTNPYPRQSLCLASAALKHSTDIMFAVAPLCLAVVMFWSIQPCPLTVTSEMIPVIVNVESPVTDRKMPSGMAIVLKLGPYACALIWCISTAALGAAHPEKVEHQLNHLYCVVNIPWLGNAVRIFATTMDVLAIIIQITTLLRIRRRWQALSVLKARSSEIDISMILRAGIFTLFQVFYLISCTFPLIPGREDTIEWNDLLYPTLVPLALATIFGTRRDYLDSWLSWLWTRPGSATDEQIQIQLDVDIESDMSTARRNRGSVVSQCVEKKLERVFKERV